MKRLVVGAALAAAVSLGAVQDATAQSSVAERVRRAQEQQRIEAARRDSRGGWGDRRDDRSARYDSRLNAVRLGEYLRGISLNRGQRNRVERAWAGRGTREQRLRVVRTHLNRTQQRRFDVNVSRIERRYGYR